MKWLRSIRAFIIVGALAALLASVLMSQSGAQSEFLSGNGFPYSAFDRLPFDTIEVKGGTIRVAFSSDDNIALPREKLLEWVRTSANAVVAYYGTFPVRMARVLVVPASGSRVQGGTTWGYRGGAIRMRVGRDATEDELRRDWVMTHEMVHLALPDVEERHGWLSEGLAVYVEPIARAQAGDLGARKVWADMIRDMPKGLPEFGDRGLDNTGTWGRKYWGGAMFCLMADVEIRKRTNNRVGLQDAMRGVLAAGGNHESYWPIGKILSAADAATGTDVMTKLYEKMAPQPSGPDLRAFWRELGVSYSDGELKVDEAAPLSSIRAAITQPRKS